MNEFEKRYEKVTKAKNRKEENRFFKWYAKNKYTVCKTIFFPLYFAIKLKEKYDSYLYNKYKWSEEQAKEFCDVILPKQCEKTENGFYLYNNYYNFYIKGEKKKYKIFDRRYHSKIIKYITDTYQIEGYEKIVLQKDYYGIEVEWNKI